MLKKTIILFLLICNISSFSQVVYEHINNNNIYDFLDELANIKIIELNSVIKPYDKMFIYKKLKEARINQKKLSLRQRKELNFYINTYKLELNSKTTFRSKTDLLKKNNLFSTAINPLGIFYKNSKIFLSLKPIYGYEYSKNENGNYTHIWGGLELTANLGVHISFYTSLRDNNINKLNINYNYFIQDHGVPKKKFGANDIDFSEARGGIFYSWEWGSIGIVKDHLKWGNNYYGANIFSGRTPSFAMIKLNLKPCDWFEFNYFHGWLVSAVIDSTRSYWDNDKFRAVFYPKFIAANMFSFKPIKNLYLSIGNSIVYSDIGIQAAYLIPFLFYKSVDHTLNATYSHGDAGQNSQMFLDISSRNIKHLHLYGTWFVDEMSFSNLFKPDKQSNLMSFKTGFRLSDFPLKNFWLGSEYTRSNPLVYQNRLSAVTFESNEYNLGHYLRDNSDIYNFSFGYKPLRGLHFSFNYSQARHGNDFDYKTIPTNRGLKFMEDVTWKNQTFLFNTKYEIVNNTYIYAKLLISNIEGFDVDGHSAEYYLNKYTPEYYQGKNTTFTIGANIGF